MIITMWDSLPENIAISLRGGIWMYFTYGYLVKNITILAQLSHALVVVVHILENAVKNIMMTRNIDVNTWMIININNK